MSPNISVRIAKPAPTKTTACISVIMRHGLAVGLIAGWVSMFGANVASADKLDDILSSGELRCAVTLTSPPNGFRNENNDPVGFDVDYCKDLAASLGVKATVVEAPWADRIPALVSNRADVTIAGASDTLERAQTVGFSIPYMVYSYQTAVQAQSDIKNFDDLKGRRVATVVSSTNETYFLEYFNKWNDPKGEHLSLQTEADIFLALQQGRVDAIVSDDTVVANFVRGGKFPNIKAGPIAPFPVDVTSLMTARQEYGLLKYLDLFVNRQVRGGRYHELYKKWFLGEAPSLTIPDAYR